MSKVKKTLLTAAIISAVGITYAIATLKVLPDALDWEEEHDDA